ncbi:phosphate ABC transporter substrate-binding protein PstS [Aeromicrobium sp. UC242_57]|uniref:phosphate ABC transporter substrate-binding protein PstS n=1 Tax=Aeromicrobium sp. UC242_57 TaxID=3374624 RepID=UPI00379B12F4
MNRKNLRIAAPAALIALTLGLSACGAGNESSDGADTDNASGATVSGTLNGAGASSQEAAIAAWKAAFQTTNSGATVNYDPVGSGGGREQFIAGGVSFAGSDAYLDDEELAKAKAKCGTDIVEIPVYVSPIAVIYNLDGVDDLQLSPKTVGAIFEGTITKWDDAAIKADNPDATLPSTNITAVHRSDDSGTTKNFTDYLDQASDGGWTQGEVETWPIKGGEAAEGTSGVVSAVKSGNGTIGYADESQAGELGKAKIKVGDAFVEPTPEAAAQVLDTAAPRRGTWRDQHRRRRRSQDDRSRRLSDRPGLVPDGVPEVLRLGHDRPGQVLADLRRQPRGTEDRRIQRRLRAALERLLRQGAGRDRHDRRCLTCPGP